MREGKATLLKVRSYSDARIGRIEMEACRRAVRLRKVSRTMETRIGQLGSCTVTTFDVEGANKGTCTLPKHMRAT